MNDKLVYPKNMLNLSRSKWKMPHRHKTTFMHGRLVPFDVIEVLPGDTLKLDTAELIRMSTPIAPIMDNIEMHLAGYFVPNRLVFDNWEELCGANKDGAWTTGMEDVVVPYYASGISSDDVAAGPYENFSLGDTPSSNEAYMTLHDYFLAPLVRSGVKINLLPFRAYYEIWNEHYRSQVVSAPIPVDHSSNNAIIVGNDPGGDLLRVPENLGKFPDYFTKALPEPQKGPDVSYLSSLIPVDKWVAKTDSSILTAQVALGAGVTDNGTYPAGSVGDIDYFNSFSPNSGTFGIYANGTADGVMHTINDLRYAFQLQKFLEKDARFGTRYFEYLNAHYGVTIADSVAQRPQFLGEINFRINVDQVLSTAGATTDSNTKLGQPGANSVTGGKGSLFTFSSVEHGYILIVGGCRHDHTYPAMVSKIFNHVSKLDFYHPEFANIGEQPVLVSERNANTSEGADVIFGYQEAWAEYRFIPDKVSCFLNPLVTDAYDFWTLADEDPSDGNILLNNDFIYENRDSISRALVTGVDGPDYIADIYFDLTIVRVMPVYSIPGFADHH